MSRRPDPWDLDRLSPEERAFVDATLARVAELDPTDLARLNRLLAGCTRPKVLRRGQFYARHWTKGRIQW